ncbi:hypothetical protein [Tichowtungia aerotolerans]|uniref:TIGR03790 family protein n=1 Tax=Tichowtungia aerotolerans TaxID=2697043 RepID=A0A6P1M2K0_9BACT|nr:hypothetical protein [Tichowtungia aerotolerans]QHI68820.1 hypothetical protein GT409_04935 [Tichowtungia aerotolerans]
MKFKQILCFVLLAVTAVAQMPHQVAVLVNENSQASKKAANVFAGLHGIPRENFIYLDLPESMFSGRFECTPEEFKSRIYNPAVLTLEDRGLDNQVLALVYSVDFPIRIVTSPNDRQQMSIMGLTFLKGTVPDLEAMEKGQIVSPLFAGPGQDNAQKLPPRSLDVWAAGLKDRMPLPAMMLGYIGENGNSMETVLRCIEDGARAWQRNAGPRVLFVETDDSARSGPREWQFDGVKAEMTAYAGVAVVTTNPAPHQKDLTGVMTGAATVKPADCGTFLPGAMAEHLTSWSAEFQKPQTKCTAWLEAGVTVTAGMVTEPYNNWVKFPHARFFAHYAAGCSAMESFYQSIASPMQVLLLGDPLSLIGALPVQIKPVGLSKEITSDLDAAFVVDATFPVKTAQPVYSALLNGREIKHGEGNSLVELPFAEMSDGYHNVRLIVQALVPGRQVLPSGFKDVPVFINKKGRSVAITGLNDDLPSRITVTAETKGGEIPQSLYLLGSGRKLAEAAPGEALIFDEKIIGEGPQHIQAVAVYADGMEVRSEPASFAIEFNPADQ